MTCYNRRETTLRCLEHLYAQPLSDGVSFKVYLVDDGCSDGTGAAVKAAYPDVEVIRGTGDLFWCNGMRLAWEHAAKEDPDFYLWLNDDVQLRPDAVARLLATHGAVCSSQFMVCGGDQGVSENSGDNFKLQSSNSQPPPTIIVGSTCDPETGEHTYGGQRRPGRHPAKLVPVIPQDVPVECDTFQGNVILVPRAVYKKVGNMRPFGHAMGDTDYGLRAKKTGCRVVVALGFLGSCSKNRQGILAETGFRKSWEVMMRRLSPGDYCRFLHDHAGWRWPFYWARPYINLFFSGIMDWMKRNVR